LLHTDYTSLAGKSRVSTIFGMTENNDSITSEAMEIESKDGNKKIIFCNSAQVKDSDNLLSGYVYVLKDITEQAKIETQLQLSQKMEAVGQLAAGIAHEINTPMQYIMDNTLFLKESFAGLKDYIKLADKCFPKIKIQVK
jgi:nitrogen-specific signal transduction histidine kinase